MNTASLLRWPRKAIPVIATVLIFLLAGMLPFAIFLTLFSIQWVAFLVGVVVAASLALASRESRSRWIIARRNSQLKSARERLAKEIEARTKAQELLAWADAGAQLIDNAMPVALAYVDAQLGLRYHNRAFADWAGGAEWKSDARSLHDAGCAAAKTQMEANLALAFSGRTVRCEQLLAPRSGAPRLYAAQYVPHFGDRGEVPGVFVTLLEVPTTDRPALPRTDQRGPPPREGHAGGRRASDREPAREASGDDVRERIMSALTQDDFSLYSQEVVRINAGSGAPGFRDVLLRLDEEEDYHLPPGAFLSLAEECGMLPALDAWQVRTVAKWLAADPGRCMETCGINVSRDTLADPGFVATVRAALREHRIAGRALCLEICADDLPDHLHEMIAGIRELQRDGVRFALTGFGRGPVPLRMVREIEPDYVKIDGGIIVGVVRSEAQAARLSAINRVAHACGAATIAECVEDEQTRTRLVQLGVDFAQGSVISDPKPMRDDIRFAVAA